MTRCADRISLIGLPYHCGTRGRVPGNAMALGPEVLLTHAPSALSEVFEDLEVQLIEDADQASDKETGGDFRLIPAGDQMGRILVQNIRLSQTVRAARKSGRIPIVALGTCSGSLGLVAGLGDEADDIGIVWFDAHGDAQTPETSANGFIEGMVCTTLTGKCWPLYRRQIPGFKEVAEERFISVSIHEAFSSRPRAHASVAVGTIVNPPVIQRLGYTAALVASLEMLRARCRTVYVHIDTDVLDPTVLRSNRHCADGGLTKEQVVEGLHLIADRFEILAVGLSAFDPDVDPRGPDVLVPILVEAAEAAARSKT